MENGTSIDDVTGAIVDAAFKLHTGLGPGLLELVYEMVLARDLARLGFDVERQKIISFEYDGMPFPDGFRIDGWWTAGPSSKSSRLTGWPRSMDSNCSPI